MFKVLLGIVLVATACSAQWQYSEHEAQPFRPNRENVTQMIKSQGYPALEYEVVTSDGYILDLIRIPYGIKESPYKNIVPKHTGSSSSVDKLEVLGGDSNDQDEEDENHRDDDAQKSGRIPSRKQPVLLMSDLQSNAEDFVIDGKRQSLAFLLADYGFDVFLGNVRGSTYGLKHTVLKSNSESHFWRFGLHDMGTKDLPAIVDKVIQLSGKRSVHYLGHMLGATIFYIMTTEKPEYNHKITSMVSLGPVAFLKDSDNKILKEVADHLDHQQWIVENLGPNKFTPSRRLMRPSERDCTSKHSGDRVQMCSSTFFLLTGYNSHQIKQSSILNLIWRTPSGASSKEILDLAVMVKTGRFGRYAVTDRKSLPSFQDYDLQKMTAPVSVIYSTKDSLLNIKDKQRLVSRIPNLKFVDAFSYDNSLDLLHGEYVDLVVVPEIIKMLVSV